MKTEPTGQEASRLRQKKFATIRSLQMPEGALPGSLALCHTRCGKPTCHCAKDKGHPVWKLTYMHDGKQYIVLAVGGGPRGSELIAYALP